MVVFADTTSTRIHANHSKLDKLVTFPFELSTCFLGEFWLSKTSCAHPPCGSIASCAMQGRIVHDVEEVHKFLRVHAIAASEAAHAQIVYAQCKQLILKFNTSPMTLDEATRVLEVLADGPWTPAQALELRSACANGARPGTCSTSQKCQTFHDPENYLTPTVWKILQSDSYTDKTKLNTYAMLLNKLGLRHPTEKTLQHCTAKFWFTVRGQDAFSFTGGHHEDSQCGPAFVR